MNASEINIGDEVHSYFGSYRGSHRGSWMRVTHIEGDLIVGRDKDMPTSWWAHVIDEVRRPATVIGYERIYHGDCGQRDIFNVLSSKATHVVTHWSDGTCTLDTIAAFREAHHADR